RLSLPRPASKRERHDGGRYCLLARRVQRESLLMRRTFLAILVGALGAACGSVVGRGEGPTGGGGAGGAGGGGGVTGARGLSAQVRRASDRGGGGPPAPATSSSTTSVSASSTTGSGAIPCPYAAATLDCDAACANLAIMCMDGGCPSFCPTDKNQCVSDCT